jgi:hypothetical protein
MAGPNDSSSLLQPGETLAPAAPDNSSLLQDGETLAPPTPTTPPPPSADDMASQARQSMVAGMTGLPSPNMSAEDRQHFQTGKVLGTASGIAAGAAAAAPIAAPVVVPIAKWISDNPIKAYLLTKTLGELGLSKHVDHVVHVISAAE